MWVVKTVALRVFWGAVLLAVVSLAVFVMVSLIPGNAALTLLGTASTPAALRNLERIMGLNKPIYVQYFEWASRAVRGNLGQSLFTGQSVMSTLNQRLPTTASLIVLTMLVMFVVGVGLGILGALRRGIFGDIIDTLAVIGFSVPNFWLAVLLILGFSVKLGWLPSIGYVSWSTSPLQWLVHVLLPVVSLSFGGVAYLAKLTNAEVTRQLEQDYVTVMVANGFRRRSIVLKHVLRNAAVPIVSGLSVQFIALLSGTVLVENVFGLPGIGALGVNAVYTHDLPIIQGVAVYFTAMVVIINILAELSYAALNPRVR